MNLAVMWCNQENEHHGKKPENDLQCWEIKEVRFARGDGILFDKFSNTVLGLNV